MFAMKITLPTVGCFLKMHENREKKIPKNQPQKKVRVKIKDG